MPYRARTDRFLYQWPMYARIAGLVIGAVEMVGGLLGLNVSTAVLAFAGGLVVMPNVVGAQDTRNLRRQEELDQEVDG